MKNLTKEELIMKYTKEYCITMHRKLWNTIYEIIKETTDKFFTEEEKTNYVNSLEDDFIYDMKLDALDRMDQEDYSMPDFEELENDYNNCFCCLYAFSKDDADSAMNRSEGGDFCQNCPVKWNDCNYGYSFQCCKSFYGALEDVQFETVEELLDLVEKISALPVRENV